MKHTPGPWQIERHSQVDKSFAIYDRGRGDARNEICRLDFDDVDHQEVNANAKLIASAPILLKDNAELLEALRWTILFVSDLRYHEQKVRKQEIETLIKSHTR